jgi:allantoate deiminase
MLERAASPLVVVTAIVGYARAELFFEGRAGHAGTTPMSGREDALVEAAYAILRIREAAASIEGAVATVGELDVEPGAGNVIPGRARLSVAARPRTENASTTWLRRSVSSLAIAPSPWRCPNPGGQLSEPRSKRAGWL